MTTQTGNRQTENDQLVAKLVQLSTFRLAGRLLGVNILDVKEVSDDIMITPIHHAPSKIRGYMNIRGQIHLVVDLRAEFGFESDELSMKKKVIIFKQTVDEPFGILVDSIGDVVEVDVNAISQRRSTERQDTDNTSFVEKRQANQNLCEGVCPLDSEVMLVLNARGILQ